MIKDWIKALLTTFATAFVGWYLTFLSAVILFITGVDDAAFGFMLAAICALSVSAAYTGWMARDIYDKYTD